MGSRDWSNLDVSPATKRFIGQLGFARMTPVQAIAIPLLLSKRDVAVEACTGSGKTLAFLIPIVEILQRCIAAAAADNDENTSGLGVDAIAGACHIGATVLAPTRELAGQIHEVLTSFITSMDGGDEQKGGSSGSTASPLAAQLIVGGSEPKAAAEALIKSATASPQWQVVVATPGRLRALMDLTGTRTLNFKPLEVFVMDEADRLLQMGFQLDLEAILSAVPKQRRTGLFSATLTSELQRLMRTGMRNPVHVCVRRKREERPPELPPVLKTIKDGSVEEAGPDEEQEPVQPVHEVPKKLKNFVVTLPAQEKVGFLLRFLRTPEVQRGKTIVFFLTCACVDFFHALLGHLLEGPRKKAKGGRRRSVGDKRRLEKLHGHMEPKARKLAYSTFSKAPATSGRVLLATDVAARGIDVEAVSWIVQFDPPADPAAFVHRIGRTARAGGSGQAMLMLMPHEEAYLPYLRQQGIPLIEEDPCPGLRVAGSGGDGGGEGGADEQAEEPTAAAAFERDAALRRGRRLLETDRNAMLKGNNAFVSFVRGYQEHQLSYLFPLKNMDLGAVATGFCLLRLPRIKEILGRKLLSFQPSAVDPANVPFKSRAQEKLRLERQAEKAEEVAAEVAEREKRRAKAKMKAAKAKPKKQRTRTEKRRAKRKGRWEEWEALQAEERLAKKSRKGRISAEEFEVGVRKAVEQIRAGQGGHSRGRDKADSDAGDLSDSDDVGAAGAGKSSRWLTGRKRRRAKKGKR